MWYKRLEAQRRFSFFVNAATFAGAFGGLLATGIGHMNGVRGYHAWRWIFILEGLATCVLALLAFFLVSDFPENAHWLSHTERAFIIQRLAQDQGDSDLEEKITWKGTLASLADVKTVTAGFMYFGLTMSGYSKYRCAVREEFTSNVVLQVLRTSFPQLYLHTATRPFTLRSIPSHRGLPRSDSPC
jgi:MFS family permease